MTNIGIIEGTGFTGSHNTRKFLLARARYRISDIISILNHKKPAGRPKAVHRNDLTKPELGSSFRPARLPLHRFLNQAGKQLCLMT